MNDFWISCGHQLLDRDQGGGLLLTDEFLKVYLARPELIPPPEACAVERTLHDALLANPRLPVLATDVAAIADADARENWQLLIAFRDLLRRHKTLEGAYAELMRNGPGNTPLLFVNQLVHVILRNALDGVTDARVVRAAELFFRNQRVTVHENSLIAADEETIGFFIGRDQRILMHGDTLVAEEQLGGAHHARIRNAVERVAQDHMHELIDEQQRRVTGAIAHKLSIGAFQRLVAQQQIAEGNQQLPVLARVGVGDGRDVCGRHRQARIGEQRAMQRALDRAGLRRRDQLRPRQVD